VAKRIENCPSQMEEFANFAKFKRRWQSSRGDKSLAEWDLCHRQSVFATLPHSALKIEGQLAALKIEGQLATRI